MIITRNWLSKFIDLKNISNHQISVALNSLGFEVEEEHDFSQLNDELVIGFVEQSGPIKDTHLRFNLVNVGSRTLEIVCGADNVDANQLVIVAQPGQTIANGLTLGEREIRGYKSQGMICALNEIGIPNSSLNKIEEDSIYVIEGKNISKADIGTSIAKIGLDDYIWDMDLTLDRSDALGATQLLKEIANYFDLKINWTSLQNEVKTSGQASTKIVVSDALKNEVNTIAVQELAVKNLITKFDANDDLWLKLCHAKTNDNLIEDIAMMSGIESGQPVIVLDKQKIQGDLKLELIEIENKVFVALTNNGHVVNLVGQKVEPTFAVSSATTEVIALYFNFNPVLMRKQQKALDTSTIALQRFMKPLNPNLFSYGSTIFNAHLSNYDLLTSTSNLKIELQKVKAHNIFKITLAKINTFLGLNLTIEQIKGLFKTLDIVITNQGDELTFTVDENRTDLYGQFDVCEEVARLYGYDNIPEVPPVIFANKNSKKIAQKLETKVGDYLIGAGFNNTKTYSLITSEQTQKWNLFNLKEPINLMSPLSKLHETYRLSLVNSLIDVASYNSAIDNKKVKLWEIADVYTQDLTREKHLAGLITGDIIEDKVNKIKVENNYFYLKGIVEAILDLYKIDRLKVSFTNHENVINEIHPFVNAKIKYEQTVLGYLFALNPKYANIKKIASTFAFELSLTALEKVRAQSYVVQPLSKFQQSTRDISLLMDEHLRYEDVYKAIIANVEHLIDVKLIDEYQDQTLMASKQKALALSFTFNALDKQMSEADINQQWDQVLGNVQKLGLIVR